MDAMNAFAPLLGAWRGEEEIMPSQWGPGGPATATMTWRATLGGKAIALDYHAARDGRTWLEAHAVFTAQPALAMHWFDSLGFVPPAPAEGQAEGGTLVFVRRSPRGMTRHTWALDGADACTLRLDSSFDGGATWVAVMQGRYLRAGAAP